MPVFRSGTKQAEHIIRKVLAFGKPRHHAGKDGLIHSKGTARAYRNILARAAEWDKRRNGARGIRNWREEDAQRYLAARAAEVSQKTLSLERQALKVLPGVEGRPTAQGSALGTTGHGETPRAYTGEQVEEIAAHQQPKNALSTRLAADSGLRAHEILTLRRVEEQPPSRHQAWRSNRFAGRVNAARYSVVGKGGLVREVAVSKSLAVELERRRLEEGITIRDRGIAYRSFYDVAGGHKWSNSFSAASNRALGFSTGAHGLRHSYAQNRMRELAAAGASRATALGIVSQELGHFRKDITEVYLR